jgi:hypothetical protein
MSRMMQVQKKLRGTVITTGNRIFTVWEKCTVEVVRNTANLLPCVDTRRTTHGSDYHGEEPLPCVPTTHTW